MSLLTGGSRVLRRFRNALSRRLRGSYPPLIWEGVYPDFESVPTRGGGFGGLAAIDAAERLLRDAQNGDLSREAVLDHQVAALAMRMVAGPHVSFLDFGGGVGHSHAVLKRLTNRPILSTVVRLSPLVERARTLWAGHDDITFAASVEELPRRPEVVFSKSALQYFPDYEAQFRQLLALGAAWVVLEKLPLLQSAEFVTGQVNVYDSVVPYWFMSADRLQCAAEDCGYRLVLQRRLEREYDQWNFPPELRMGRAASLMFEKVNR